MLYAQVSPPHVLQFIAETGYHVRFAIEINGKRKLIKKKIKKKESRKAQGDHCKFFSFLFTALNI